MDQGTEVVITELHLHELAGQIPNDKVEGVGFRLDVGYASIKRYREMNARGAGVTAEGTEAMLQAWYQKTPKSDCNAILKEALTGSGLTQLAEDFLG